MTLAAGQNLGHYRLVEKIGEGGMGVVWRAEDAALGRDVAIKVLPEALAEDAERLSRFEREAKLLASLSHPNIATVHGLHADGGIRFLAMELVRGEDLAKRLTRGPLPADEAIAVGRQVAEALEAAHEHGVIHRDLKPANIIVAPDGMVKVLDFGLAKVLQSDPASGDPSLSPTLTHPGTAAGLILGTAAYMSPEQARGRAVDRRADIWAFGCVLLECLTGRRLFSGETVSDVLAAVLRAEVDWTLLPSSTPPAVAALLRRCLDRDPRRRLRDIGEARVALESPPQVTGTAPVPAPKPRRLLPAGIAALALTAVAVLLAWNLKPAAPLPLRKFVMERAAQGLGRGEAVTPVLSPDGSRVALVRDEALFVRELDELEARQIEGAVDPQMLTWSPDGAWIAFASGTRLLKVPVSGGAVQLIAELPGRPSTASGAAWLADGNIVFTTGGTGLLSVSSQGGDPRSVLEPAEGENDFHNVSPLPGGRAVVFVVHGKLMSDTIAVFDGGRRKDVLRVEGQWLGNPVCAHGGHLLYVRSGNAATIWSAPFSLKNLETTGEPFLVASGATGPSVGADGTLLYTHGGGSRLRQLVWLDRSGELLETLGEPRRLQQPALSPDGTRVAAVVEEEGDTDIWIADLGAGTWNRLTFTPTPEHSPRWFPGGDRLAFVCQTDGVESLCARAADGSGETDVLVKTADTALDISRDGRWIVYDAPGRGTRIDLWMREEGDEPRPLLATADYESNPRLSPDGRLVAHVGWEQGREDVYLREFPSGSGKWQISSHGGELPTWGGQELFYVDGQTLLARRITSSGGVQVGPEQRLFDLPSLFAGFDVSKDGQKILVVRRVDEEAQDELVIVQNWFAEFSGR